MLYWCIALLYCIIVMLYSIVGLIGFRLRKSRFQWPWMVLVISYQPNKLESNVIEYSDYLDLDWITSVIHWNSISCSRFKYRVFIFPLYHHKKRFAMATFGHEWSPEGVWWPWKRERLRVHQALIWLWVDSERWLSLSVIDNFHTNFTRIFTELN